MIEEDPPRDGAASGPPAVATVSVKLSPFWPSEVELWFAQVEAHFTTRCIMAQFTRFDYVIDSLTPEVAAEVHVCDLILKPPEDQPYTALREQLIIRTAASEQGRLQQLFHAEELGDRKPSQLLQHMQQLLGDRADVTDSTLSVSSSCNAQQLHSDDYKHLFKPSLVSLTLKDVPPHETGNQALD